MCIRDSGSGKLLRPGHADYTGFVRYQGYNDPAGGGHFSGRLTAPLVFAGAIAESWLAQKGIVVAAHALSIGPLEDAAFDLCHIDAATLNELKKKEFPTLDPVSYTHLPGCSMDLNEKLDMAQQLERLGVDIIEAGFAISSPGDLHSVAEIAKVIKNAQVCSLARTLQGDIDAAYEAVQYAVAPRIHTFLATSPVHMKYKLKMTPEEVIDQAATAVALSLIHI